MNPDGTCFNVFKVRYFLDRMELLDQQYLLKFWCVGETG